MYDFAAQLWTLWLV